MKYYLAVRDNKPNLWPYKKIYDACDEVVSNPHDADVCIAWTMWRGGKRRRIADQFTESGRPVICMENGWLKHRYQMNLRKPDTQCSGVNGAGTYKMVRFFDFDYEPWHQGEEIVVCPQRGLTPNDPDIAHGQDWADKIVGRIREYSDRPILWKVRPDKPCLPKDQSDITIIEGVPENPWCCVVYSSLIAIDFLMSGTPVVADGEQTMYAEISNQLQHIENLTMPSRDRCFQKMANQQWHINDLRMGMETLLESKN